MAELTALEQQLLDAVGDELLRPIEAEDFIALRGETRNQLLDEILARLDVSELECECSQWQQCLKHRVLDLEQLRSGTSSH